MSALSRPWFVFFAFGVTILATALPCAAQGLDPVHDLQLFQQTGDQPIIEVTPPQIEAVIYRGTPEAVGVLTLTNTGSGDMQWRAQVVSGGLSATFDPETGTLAEGESIPVTVTIDTMLGAGDYLGSVGFRAPSASNSPFDVPVSIRVLDNSAPVALDETFIVSEDTPQDLTLGFTDDGFPDGVYGFSIITPPTQGMLLQVSPGVYNYTPRPDYSGVDSFTWMMSDGLLESNLATTTLAINDQPIAFGATASTLEDQAVTINLTYEDPDLRPGPYSTALATEPANGVATETGPGQYLYTPNLGHFGTDSFTWVVNDGQQDSEPATVDITIEGLPEISLDRTALDIEIYRGTQEIVETLLLTNSGAADMDWSIQVISGGLTATFVPESGILAPGASTAIDITIETVLNTGVYVGSVGIGAPGATNTPVEIPITLTVLDNTAPTAIDQSFFVSENTPLELLLEFTDDGFPNNTYASSIVDQPTNGILEQLSPGRYTFTPRPNFSGADSFTWKLSDTLLESNIATATLHINDQPIAFDLSTSTLENEDVRIELSFDDPDMRPGPYTTSITTEPENGTTTEVGLGQYLYTPNADYFGVDTFEWVINDGQQNSEPATVDITIAGVPEIGLVPATIVAEIYRGTEEVVETLVLTNTGADTMDWSARVVSGGIIATFVPDSGVLEPSESTSIEVTIATLLDTGVYSASLGVEAPGATNDPFEIPVTLTVLENSPPSANDQIISASEDTPIDITLDFTDDGFPDGNNVFTILSQPTAGSLLEVSPGVYTYNPDPDVFGPDTFTWEVSDGILSSNLATATVRVNGQPIAFDLATSTLENEVLRIELSFEDPDSLPGPYVTTITTDPLHGVLEDAGLGRYSYTPDPDYFGPDSFTWVLNDGQDDSETATVDIDVQGVGEIDISPLSVASEIFRGTQEFSETLVLTNTGAADLDWSATVVSGGLLATFEPAAGVLPPGAMTSILVTVESQLNAGEYSGSVGITAVGATNDPFEIPVTVTVLDNVAPTAQNQIVNTQQNTPIDVLLDYSDDGFPTGTPTFTFVVEPLHGTLSEIAPGEYTYEPDEGFFGPDSVEWNVSDGLFTSANAIATLRVNTVPVAFDIEVIAREDEQVPLEPLFADEDMTPGPHSITIVDEPQNGIVMERAFGKFLYIPNRDYLGTDSFTWQVSDGQDESNLAVVNLTMERQVLAVDFSTPAVDPPRTIYGLNRGLDSFILDEYFESIPIGFFRGSVGFLDAQGTRVLETFPDAYGSFLIFPKPHDGSGWELGGGGDKERAYDPHNECIRDENNDCPPDQMNWSSLDGHLEFMFDEIERRVAWLDAIEEGRFVFGPWNEAVAGTSDFDPELGSSNFKGTEADFFATWEYIHNAIQARFPGARTCGPSYGSNFSFDEGGGRNGRFASFMEFIKDNNIDMDAICVHAIASSPERFEEYALRLAEYRDLYVNEEYGASEIHVEENLSESAYEITAIVVGMIEWLERAGADRAGKDSWDRSGDGTFGGLLTADQEPLADYWAVKTYGEMLTGRVAVDNNGYERFPMFATVADGVGKVLFAKYTTFFVPDDAHKTQLRLGGLEAIGAGPYTITIEHLDDAAVPLLEPEIIASVTTDLDLVAIDLNVQDDDAYVVTITTEEPKQKPRDHVDE